MADNIIFFIVFYITFIFVIFTVAYNLTSKAMKIGILTSRRLSRINATIRGVCKTAINHYGMEVYGIHSGFRGLLDNDVEPLTEKSLSGLLNLGGTILGTSREKPFKKRLSAASRTNRL